MIKGTLYGVGVGPGDPRLMTYLAVDTIQKCPVIAVPADGKENAVSYKIASGIVENLDEKQDYKELPDTYIIFITENDYYKAGEPVYTIQNMNLTLNRPFNDGAHILYVNGEYRDDSEIGRLMHDFNCTSADEMNFELLAERTRYLKENPKGVSEMCKVMEDLRVESYTEGREEQARMMAQKLYRKGYSIEEIADMVEYSTEKVEEWLTPKAG